MHSRKITLIMANQALGSVLGMFALLFMTRYIDKTEVGLFAFAFGFVALLSFFGDMGFSQAHVKKVSEGRDLGECIGSFLAVKVFLTLSMIGIVLAAVWVWEHVLHKDLGGAAGLMAVMIILFYFSVVHLKNIFLYTFQARIKTAIQESLNLAENVVRSVGIIVVAILAKGPVEVAWAYVAGGFASLILAASIFVKHRYPISRPNLRLVREYAVFALPLSLSISLTVIALNTDKVMIQLFWNPDHVANYFLSQKAVFPLISVSTAVAMVLFPAVSSAHSMGNMEKVRDLTRNAVKYFLMLLTPVAFFVIAFPAPIIHLFSAGYGDAAPVLMILSIYALIRGCFVLYSGQVNGLGHPKTTAKATITISLLNIVLNLMFIPKSLFGVPLLGLAEKGAALATLTAIFVGFGMVFIASRRLSGSTFRARNLLHPLAGGLMACTLLSISHFYYPHRIYELIGFLLLGLGIYGGILAVLREIGKEDLSLLTAVTDPRLMAIYIRDEMANRGTEAGKEEGERAGREEGKEEDGSDVGAEARGKGEDGGNHSEDNL
ncbi:MAG: flippase [Thermoplasmata archaeon]|nr:flippase [Thermoplasmata archaeon]